jgi:hypothetical protein
MANTQLGQVNSYLPFYRAIGEPNVNARDALRQGDDSGTPLQFRYEPADCRIYYTAQMTTDISASWKAAADSMWGTKNRCVAGSLQQGTIGQMPTMKQKGNKEKRKAVQVSTKLAAEPMTRLEVDQYRSLLTGLDVYTNQISKLKAQGLMLP